MQEVIILRNRILSAYAKTGVLTGTLPASPARKGGVEGSYIKTA